MVRKIFAVALCVSCCLIAVIVQAQPDNGPVSDDDYRIYSDDSIFNQLSGAKQSILERKFGKKRRTGAKDSIPPANILSLQPQGPFSAVQPLSPSAITNVPVNNRTADTTTSDTQSETSIVLGSTSSTIIVGFNDSGSTFGGASHFTGYARSTDGGATFADLGTLPNSASGDAGDPTLARSALTGTIVFSTLGFTTGAVLPVFRSTDNGATWGAPTNAVAVGNNDKQWLTADNFPGTNQGNFYLFWRDFAGGGGMTTTRSTDDGHTWGGKTVLAAGSGQGAFVAVSPDHAINYYWLSGQNIVRKKSTDGGATFTSQSTITPILSTGTNGDLALQGGFRTNAFPHVAINPVSGHQYLVYNDKSSNPADKADILFKMSTDGGSTWSAPTLINDDGGTNDQWQPTIAVTGDGSHLMITYYDRRNDPSNNLIERSARIGKIVGGSVTFGQSFIVSSANFPVVIGQDPAVISTYMGDYDFAVADNSTFYIAWGDNRSPLLTHANQPDVLFAKFDEADPGPVIVKEGVTLHGENCASGFIDPNEIVNIDVTIKNIGFAPTTNLIGTLEASDGVTLPGPSQTYGLVPIGASVTRTFSFTASGFCGGSVKPRISFTDGTTNFPSVTESFVLGNSTGTTDFSNVSPITINDNTSATPYPSTINVAFPGSVGRVTVTLTGLSHTFPDDIDILLVGPTGQTLLLMSDAGGSTPVSNITIEFDDQAAASLPDTTVLASGTFKPANYDSSTDAFAGPAPGGPYGTTLSVFSGLNPNGTWSLYVRDDTGVDVGTIQGWSIRLHTFDCCTGAGTSVPPVANNDEVTVFQNSVNNTLNVLANDTDAEADPLTVSVVSDPPDGTATIGPGNASVRYTPDTSFLGTDTFTYTVTDGNGGVSTGIITVNVVTPPACVFTDDFEDAIVDLSKWTILKPAFVENVGDFVGTPSGRKAIAIAGGFAGCGSSCTVDTTMSTTGGIFSKMWLVAWYIDKKNTVELLMKEGSDKWILRQRVNGVIVRKDKVLLPISPNVAYAVNLSFDGTSFQLRIDGNSVLTLPKANGSNPFGTFGYQVKGTTGRFSRICVN